MEPPTSKAQEASIYVCNLQPDIKNHALAASEEDSVTYRETTTDTAAITSHYALLLNKHHGSIRDYTHFSVNNRYWFMKLHLNH